MSLIINEVSKSFISKDNRVNALDKISFTINKGEFICIVGPSGCGKSTLLNVIAGLSKPCSGAVYINSREIKTTGTDRALIFQEPALFPWLTVIENVEFGMKVAGIAKPARREQAMKYLKMVHLTKFANSCIHELSGGMKQRVALARALTLDCEVLLMDEPFASLDSQTKHILRNELQKIWAKTQKTILFVTHDVEEAVILADKVAVMSTNPGKIKKVFEIDITRPRHTSNIELTIFVDSISKVLKDEVKKVIEGEYDNDWDMEQDNILSDTNNNMGIGV